MSTAHVTNNLQNGTLGDATAVMTNYNDILAFLNTLVVHEDGSIPMTGALTLQGNVTSALHAVPFQQHEDGPSALSVSALTLATSSAATATSYATYDQTMTVANPGRAVALSARFEGAYLVDAASGTVTVFVQYSVDGGSTWVDGSTITAQASGQVVGGSYPISAHAGTTTVTPSGTIQVRVRFKGTAVANARIQSGSIHLIVVPA